MDEKEEKLRSTLAKTVQKAHKTVQTSVVFVESALKESATKVSSLANLLEQYESCRAVDQQQIPFHSEFPDVKMKVLLKLSEEISGKQDELRKRIDILKEMEEKVTKFHKNCMGIISRGISLSAITTGTPTSPPLADMVEWLEVLSNQLYEQYYCKLHLLDEMMTDEDISSMNLLQKWTDQDDTLLNSLKDTLVFMGPDLEEKG